MTTNNTTDLTICTVSFRSKRHIELNWRLVEHLNSLSHPQWLIAQNTPLEEGESIDLLSGRWRVVTGCPYDPSAGRPASVQHACSLNKLVSMVETRFLLILDPDFYIVSKEWIDGVTRHMLDRGLALFGAPYNPKWFYKYRYFPCAHCLFVDLARVKKLGMDFRPGQDNGAGSQVAEPIPSDRWKGTFLRTLPQRIYKALQLASGFDVRSTIGKSQDTGYDLYRRYGKDAQIKAEYVIPVFQPETSYQIYPRWINQLLDQCLPDHLSYVPKRVNSYTRDGFQKRGFMDATYYGWEEYVWKDEPFGFHVRRVMNRLPDVEQQFAYLSDVLVNLTGINLVGNEK